MVRSALLVPVKRFTAAKRRLSTVLSATERAELARWLATSTIAAAGSLEPFVACDDDEVRTWADREGATVLWTPGLGLNGAVDESRRQLDEHGFEHVVIAHSDLPLARDLGEVVNPGSITLIPDHHLDGTNVMALPAGAAVRASYGARSFTRHRRRAEATGLAVEIREDDDLSYDVDTPADLGRAEFAEVLPRWAIPRADRH